MIADVTDTQRAEAPFEPEAADLGGCGKPAVIGCLAALVVLAVLLVVFLFKARDMLDWALAQYQETVVSNLSDEVTSEDRERLEAAFERARNAIRENRLQPGSVQRLQRFMTTPPRQGEPLGPETVRELTEVLEGLEQAPSSSLESLPLPAGELAAISVTHAFV